MLTDKFSENLPDALSKDIIMIYWTNCQSHFPMPCFGYPKQGIKKSFCNAMTF